MLVPGQNNKWDKNGDLALEIFLGLAAGNPDCREWNRFRDNNKRLILEYHHSTGVYKQNNLLRNHKAAIEHYDTWKSGGGGKTRNGF